MKKLLLMAFLAATTVSAQFSPDLGAMMTSSFAYGGDAKPLAQSAAAEPATPQAAERLQTLPEIKVSSAEVESMAKTLAQHFPADHREQAQQLYIQLYNYYDSDVEKPSDRTLAAAFAHFLIANYHTYHNTALTPQSQADALDKITEQVEKQFAAALLANPGAYEQVAAATKKEAYLQAVMIGTQMLVVLGGHQGIIPNVPDDNFPAAQAAAKNALEDMTKVPVDKIHLTENGLSIDD